MALGMHFDIFGSLCAPVPGLLVYLEIDFELGHLHVFRLRLDV